MLMCKARTAVIRNGKVIPGGTPFGIRESERDEMDARGFKVYEVPDPVPPKTANDITPPEKEPGENTGDKSGAIQGSVSGDDGPKVLSGGASEPAAKMGESKGAKDGKE